MRLVGQIQDPREAHGFGLGARRSLFTTGRHCSRLPDDNPVAWLAGVIDQYQISGCHWTPRTISFIGQLAERRSREIAGPARRSFCSAAAAMGESPELLSRRLLTLGTDLDDSGAFDESAAILCASFVLLVHRKDLPGSCDCALLLARALRKLTEFDRAVAWYQCGEGLAKAGGLPGKQSEASVGLASVALNRGDIPSAHRHYGEALTVGLEADHSIGIARAHHGLVSTNRRLGDRDASLRHALEAARYYESADDRALMAVAAGMLLLEGGQPDAAGAVWESAAATASSPDAHAFSLLALAFLSATRGDRASFDRLFDEVRSWLPSCQPETRVQASLYHGKALESLGDRRAARVLEDTIEMASELGMHGWVFEAEADLESVRQSLRSRAEPGPESLLAARVRAGFQDLVGV